MCYEKKNKNKNKNKQIDKNEIVRGKDSLIGRNPLLPVAHAGTRGLPVTYGLNTPNYKSAALPKFAEY
jgi:hypothetical protein